MSKQQHSHHNHPLGPAPKKSAGRLPKNKFGGLVGVLDHITLGAHNSPKPDDNHVYIWLRVPAGPVAGKYECAFNTASSAQGSQSEFAVKEEAISLADFPNYGFWNATVSFQGLGLTQADFTPISNGSLRTAVFDWAHNASIIAAYGITYSGGDGLHDIHMNSGEPPNSGFPNLVNQDGALVFYYRAPGEEPFRRWVFVKFSTQTL